MWECFDTDHLTKREILFGIVDEMRVCFLIRQHRFSRVRFNKRAHKRKIYANASIESMENN